MPNKFSPGDAVERISTGSLVAGTVKKGLVGVVCRQISDTHYAVFFTGMPKCVTQLETSLQSSEQKPPKCPPNTPGC